MRVWVKHVELLQTAGWRAGTPQVMPSKVSWEPRASDIKYPKRRNVHQNGVQRAPAEFQRNSCGPRRIRNSETHKLWASKYEAHFVHETVGPDFAHPHCFAYFLSQQPRPSAKGGGKSHDGRAGAKWVANLMAQLHVSEVSVGNDSVVRSFGRPPEVEGGSPGGDPNAGDKVAHISPRRPATNRDPGR